MKYAPNNFSLLESAENLSVSYCINPKCQQRHNAENATHCSVCSTSLLIRDKYRLLKPLRELHEQNNTEIFETVDEHKTLKVLKVLRNHHLAEMFIREAKTLQKLHDRSIPFVGPDDYFVHSLDGNNSQELHCLVMEKIEGQNLEQWLKQNKPISQDVAFRWLEELTIILEKLHEKDLIHRDIKLANIMLRPDRTLVLIDFGTVRQRSQTYYDKLNAYPGITGIVSPGYSPPEQIQGKGELKSDFYALGCSFVHLLTGVHPLDIDENPRTKKLEWRNRAPQVKSRLAKLIDDLIDSEPNKRPQNTQEILHRLKNDNVISQLNRNLGRIPSLHWLFGLNIVLLVVNLMIGVAWFRDKQPTSPVESPSSSSTIRSSVNVT